MNKEVEAYFICTSHWMIKCEKMLTIVQDFMIYLPKKAEIIHKTYFTIRHGALFCQSGGGVWVNDIY